MAAYANGDGVVYWPPRCATNCLLCSRMQSVPSDRDAADWISQLRNPIGGETPRRAVMGGNEHPLSGCRRAAAGSPPAYKRSCGLVSIPLAGTLKASGRPVNLDVLCDPDGDHGSMRATGRILGLCNNKPVDDEL